MTKPPGRHPFRIRDAAASDVPGMLEVYAPIVRDTTISWEKEPPSVAELTARLLETTAFAPWLVAEDEPGRVVGYAYATRFRERAGYRFTVEVSIYLHPAAQGQGLGRRLYQELFARLRDQGFVLAVAGIALPNPASVALHERLGFRPAGVMPALGWKFGRWHDLGFWLLELGPRTEYPTDPRPPQPPAGGADPTA